MIGISIAELIKDRGFDVVVCFDDLSKHSKSYRQISLLQNKIPSRDAFPADIFNIHSSLLERICSSRQSLSPKIGSISCLPIIETINFDIAEYIATNVISITDGQFVMNKLLFNSSLRPAIDSSLSVTRIGSNAQCRLIKTASAGIKNELTTKRNMSSSFSSRSLEFAQLQCLNFIFFQYYLSVISIETSCILLLVYRNGLLFNNLNEIARLLYIISSSFSFTFYIIFLAKTLFNSLSFTLISFNLNYVIS